MTAVSERRPKASETLPDPRELKWGDMLENAITEEGTAIMSQYSAFYPYSARNKLLLYMQGATGPCNNFQRWKAMNRNVIRGSRAMAILRPIFRKDINEAGEEEQRLSGFRYVNSVFTASQTEGEELPPVQPHVWDRTKALGALAIVEHPFTDTDGNTQGVSWGRNIAINPVAKWPLKTTTHELGHVLLGHTDPDQQAEYRQHRGLREFQAEGVAYLAMSELGLDDQWCPNESRTYLQGWLRGERPADEDIKPMFSVVDRIIRAGQHDPAPIE